MEPVAAPMPGTAAAGPAVGGGGMGRLRAGVLRCLHFLTCRMCDPPPEVSDTARLGLALAIFGVSSSILAAVLSSQMVTLAYCAFGLARLLPARSKSWALVVGLSGAAWLFLLCLPTSWASGGPVALALLSELCWLMTLRRVLDEEFDVFVAVLFFFLGVELTFGFYPLLMHYAPLIIESPQVQETVQVVVHHAVQAGKHSRSTPGQPSGLGGGSVASGSPDAEEGGPLIIFSQLLPLLALLVGVPGLAFAALVSCWMFEHMSRMVLAVSVSFVSWMALYGILTFMHVPVSRDTFGKAILGSACVLMYHAFSRLTCIDWRAAQLRLTWLGGAFAAIFAVDQLLQLACWHSPMLLFTVLVACKLTYSTWSNFLEAEGRGQLLQAKNLSPFRAGGGGPEHEQGRPLNEEQESRPDRHVPDFI
uniref:Uncharacterized protein n=1 Tax=Alexandrium monilatum TaxID=311494 RepID=A0A7S4PUY4_9DINO